MTTTILRIKGSAEFLGTVPALAGYTPRQSLAVVPFHGTRAYGAMRIDLPEQDADFDYERFADSVTHGLLLSMDADAAAFVVYTDAAITPTHDGHVLPELPLMAHVLCSAEDHGLHVIDALCVAENGWSTYLEQDPPLRLLAEIPASPEVPGLGDVSGDQAAGAEIPDADAALTQRVARALRKELHAQDGWMAGERLHEIPAFLETLLEAPSLSATQSAKLLAIMSKPYLRDVVMLQWATYLDGGVATLDAACAFHSALAPFPEHLGGIMMGLGARPDADRLQIARRLLKEVASVAPKKHRAAPLALAAWFAWAMGHSTHAHIHLEQALNANPRYSLALLIRAMLGAGIMPSWALESYRKR